MIAHPHISTDDDSFSAQQASDNAFNQKLRQAACGQGQAPKGAKAQIIHLLTSRHSRFAHSAPTSGRLLTCCVFSSQMLGCTRRKKKEHHKIQEGRRIIAFGDELMGNSQIPSLCEGCGACCVHANDNKWIEVTAQDASLIAPEFLQPGDLEPFAMKQKPNGACVCLGDDQRCTIYETRPSICRAVKRGDSICLTSINRRSGTREM